MEGFLSFLGVFREVWGAHLPKGPGLGQIIESSPSHRIDNDPMYGFCFASYFFYHEKGVNYSGKVNICHFSHALILWEPTWSSLIRKAGIFSKQFHIYALPFYIFPRKSGGSWFVAMSQKNTTWNAMKPWRVFIYLLHLKMLQEGTCACITYVWVVQHI